jgi:molybdopterin-guanine dinucleotide biosynthesis protein B
MPAKAVAIIGYKNSGKTRVVEALTEELTKRGYKIGTLKHTADDIYLDTPGKDTSRHRKAGSIATALLQENSTAVFIDKHLTLHQTISKLGPLDYIIIEGFKGKNTHTRIIVPRENSELEGLRNGLEIAVVKIPESKFKKDNLPSVYTLEQVSGLADIVENKSFPMLSGLDCHSCGYPDCLTMGKALLSGEAELSQCVGYKTDFILEVNGTGIPLGGFTRKALENVVLGFIKSLKGGEDARKVQLEFESE